MIIKPTFGAGKETRFNQTSLRTEPLSPSNWLTSLHVWRNKSSPKEQICSEGGTQKIDIYIEPPNYLIQKNQAEDGGYNGETALLAQPTDLASSRSASLLIR